MCLPETNSQLNISIYITAATSKLNIPILTKGKLINIEEHFLQT